MAGRVIVIGNEKGGCGKTTISVNLVAMGARERHDVLLVDADPGQQSAARWAARRRDMHPEAAPVPCVSLTGRIDAQVEDLRARYGLIVVDTGAEDSPELRSAALVADTLVVPLQAEALDLWTLPTVEAIFRRVQAVQRDLRVVIALNRVAHQIAGQAPEDVRGWMAENVPSLNYVAMATIIGRAAYGRAISEGLAVHEAVRPDPKAVSEIVRLFQEVIQ